MEKGWCLAAERLDHLDRGGRRANLVHVVQDEDEVASQLVLERLADERGEPARPGLLVPFRAGPARRGDRERHIARERRDAKANRIRDAVCDGSERCVL